MIINNNEPGKRFSDAIHQEKHGRLARNALYDLFAFYEDLENEINRIGAITTKLTSGEAELLEHMLAVQEHYLAAMKGLKELPPEKQQHALVRFSDSLLDLMKTIPKYNKGN